MENTLKQSQFYELFLSELKEMFWMEQKAHAMPGLVQGAVHSWDLYQTLLLGQLNASVHIEHMLHLFGTLGETAAGHEPAAMSRLIESIERLTAQNASNSVAADLPLILAVQKVFQFKMSCCENLIALAQITGERAAEEFLEINILDDTGINILLRELSERYIYKVSPTKKSTAPL